MKVTCSCCRYFLPLPNGHRRNQCRRRAPAPRLTYDGRHDLLEPGVWPVVSPEDWCGDFIPRVVIRSAAMTEVRAKVPR
jgi:hypothetical protein